VKQPLSAIAIALLASVFLAACGEDSSENQPTPDGVADALEPGDTQVASDAPEMVEDLVPDDAGDTVEVVEPDYQPVVFAIISDLHINGSFQASIPQNVVKLLADVGNLNPNPEFIAVTGDLADTLYEPVEIGAGSRMDAIKQVLGTATRPVEAVLGNHDYYQLDDPQFVLVDDRTSRDQLFREQLSLEPYYYTTHGGMKFIYINTMQGDLWNISMGLNGSAGKEQLEWLDALLSDGVPAVLFMHHPPSTVLEADEFTLDSVIQKHSDNVLAVFAGHLHLWVRSVDGSVPVYLTKAAYDGTGIHHVKVDPKAGTVQILNESDIDYGEPLEPSCDPTLEAPLTAPEALDGTYLELMISDAVAEPAGFGTYLEEAVKMIPFVLKMGQLDPSGLAISGHLAMGAWVGSAVPAKPKYVDALANGPCLQVGFLLDTPCFETSPVSLTFDLAKSLGIGLPTGHQIRVTLRDLSFYGALSDAPSITGGLMHARVDLNPGVEDLERLLVEQYCDGKIAACPPGSAENLPTCPDEPGLELFDELPSKCDVKIGSIGIRMVLGMMKTVPDYIATMDAHYTTYKASESTSVQAGSIDPGLFQCVAP